MMLAVLTLLAAVFTPETALRKALDSSAEWTMERRLAGSERVFKSSGRVDCRAGEGITWQVKAPFESSVAMMTNAMVFVDDDGRREKPLSELPHYEDLRKATDAFAAGDKSAFKGIFEIKEAKSDDGWTLTLVPEVRAMRRLFTSVELSGAALPTNTVLRSGDGGVTVIRFREAERAR